MRVLSSTIVLLTSLVLVVAVGCGGSEDVEFVGSYNAFELFQEREKNASRFDLEIKGKRVNVGGTVERVDNGKIYLVAGGLFETVALDELSQEEQAKWEPGDKVEYACVVGDYVIGTINMADCGPVSSETMDTYTATELVRAGTESASAFDSNWKGHLVNVGGHVDRVAEGKIYLVAEGSSDTVVLNDLSQEEHAKWSRGDEVEYACVIGDYALGTVSMNDCGPAGRGGAVGGSSLTESITDTPADANSILKYWSIPALLITSVLTVTAIARSTWVGWHPPMIAVMCLGVLAILNASATVVFGYTTVNSAVLTPLALLSFPVVCLLGWITLSPKQFPALSGMASNLAEASAPTQARAASPPGSSINATSVAESEATSFGGPPITVAGSAPEPSQTIAMQPNVAMSMAWLVVTGGPSEGKSIQLKEGNSLVGRSLENDLQIDDASVSRTHAMVSVRDEQFILVDLGSTSGTRIGEHRISGRQIGAGSIITIGRTSLSLANVDAFQGGPSSGETIVGSPSGSSLSLIAHSGPDAGKSFLLASAQNVIGRDPSAQVVLSDPMVSRSHAMIRVDSDRTVISDLGSLSGTQVDGEAVRGVQISVGDRVVIGQSEFMLMRPGS